jgi:hypothetical protein
MAEQLPPVPGPDDPGRPSTSRVGRWLVIGLVALVVIVLGVCIGGLAFSGG